MTRGGAVELACLYGPMAGSALLAWGIRPTKRLAVGVLFSAAWIAALLPWLDAFAREAGLWEYHSPAPSLAGMPLSLYFGWIIAWGIFAPLLAQVLGGRVWTTAAVMLVLDLRLMPEMRPVLQLQPLWFLGNVLIAAVLLIPALFLTQWTASRSHTGLRCGMLVPAFGGIFLGLPLLIESGDFTGVVDRWQSLSWFLQAGFSLAGMALSLPGLTAVRDLARGGDGTPVPLDPPHRLVTHGIYAFVRNPMQFSMTALLLLESLFLWSPWPAVLALLGIVYSEGLARWSENQDMLDRFGTAWPAYQQSVRSWLPHWKPRGGEECELWLDATCAPCSEVARWFQRSLPHKLNLRAAGEWPGLPLTRVTWHHPSSRRIETGVQAVAMALQHLTLPWAIIGWTAGLPGISHALQICFDAAGSSHRGHRESSRDCP